MVGDENPSSSRESQLNEWQMSGMKRRRKPKNKQWAKGMAAPDGTRGLGRFRCSGVLTMPVSSQEARRSNAHGTGDGVENSRHKVTCFSPCVDEGLRVFSQVAVATVSSNWWNGVRQR